MTWLFGAERYQVFFNRDELRSRKPALPPAVHRRGETRFLAPLDGNFGGTWIAVSESALTLCLLNGFPSPASAPAPVESPAPDGYTTRGLLPLSLIELPAVAGVRQALEAMDMSLYRPFLLAVFDPTSRLLASWSGRSLSLEPQALARPPLISSSFYTEEVRASRSAVFGEIESERSAPGVTQRHLAFHRSHRPERGPYSPCMHRPDAETVSFTRVEVDRSRVQLSYTPHSPCRGETGDPPLSLDRREFPGRGKG